MLRCVLCKLELAVLDRESGALEERMELQGEARSVGLWSAQADCY